MDLLEGWLGSYVHQALTKALQWKIRTSQSSQPVENVLFEDDGSNLRVKSTKRAFVQFTKIDQVTSPVQVWISDSQTHVKVTIAAAAAEQFKRAHRKRITQGTLGAIFQLTSFEIVAQHHGPKKTKITMLINELNHIGSDGSSAFGRPRPIECLEDIQELLDELQAFRAKDATSTQNIKASAMPKNVLPLSSRPSSISSLDADEDLSQALFATQAPHIGSKKRLRAEFGGQVNVGLTDAGRVDDDGPLDPRVEAASDAPIFNQDSGVDVAGKAASATTTEPRSRKLVENQNRANTLSNVEGSLGREDAKVQIMQPPSNDLHAEKKFNLLNLLGGQSKPKAFEVKLPAGRTVSDQEGASSEKPALPPKASMDSSPEPPQPQRLSSLSITNSKDPVPKVRNRVDGMEITNEPALASVLGQRKPSQRVSKRRRAQNRISRKEIRIPNNQRDLLERSDAWLPPEPGNRVPTANLPIAILEALNRRADRKASSYIDSQRDETPSLPQTWDRPVRTPSEDEQNSDQGSDSDIPFSTSQWPASSPRQPMLPPDSSIEAAEQSESTENRKHNSGSHEIHAGDKITTSPRTTRRLSTASLSSVSDMPGRRNPVRAVRLGYASADHSSSSDSNLRRNPTRTARRGEASTDHSPRTESPLTDDAADNHQQDLDLDYVLPDVQQVSSDGKQVEASTLSSATSVPKGSVPGAEAKISSADLSKVIDTQLSPNDKPHTEPVTNAACRAHSQSDHFESSGPYSSGLESELETTVPHGLDKAKDFSNQVSATQVLPSTASQQIGPVTQVKQTPYVTGRVNVELERSISHTRSRDQSPARQAGQPTFHTTQPRTTDLDNSSANIGIIGQANTGDIGGRHTANGEEALVKVDEASKASLVQAKPHDQSTRRSSTTSTTENAISSIEETFLPLKLPEEPQVSSTQNSVPSGMVAESMQDLKRKASEPLKLSPNVTKRRKPHFARVTTDLSHVGNSMQDPALMGRQMKSEFLASIRKKVVPNPSCETGSNVTESKTLTCPQQRKRSFSPISTDEHMTGVDEPEVGVNKSSLVPTGVRSKGIPDPARENIVQESSKTHQFGKPDEGSNTESGAQQEVTHLSHDTDIEYSVLILGEVSLQGADAAAKASLLQESPLKDEAIEVEKPSYELPVGDPESRAQKTVDGSVINPMADATEFPRVEENIDTANVLHAMTRPAQSHDAVQGQVAFQLPDQAQIPLQKNVEAPSPIGPKKPVHLYDQFKATYPDYTGNPQQFAKICGKIDSLVRADRMEHPSLWDDFIIRHRTEYTRYTIQCMEDALDPVPYERFYRNEIDEPKYTKRVVTPKNLHEIVPVADKVSSLKQPHVQQADVEAIQRDKAQGTGSEQLQDRKDGIDAVRSDERGVVSKQFRVKQASVATLNHIKEPESRSEQDEVELPQQIHAESINSKSDAVKGTKRVSSDAAPGAIEVSPVQPQREVIDLTEDDLEDRSVATTEAISPPAPSAKRVRRSLPWSGLGSDESSNTKLKASPIKSVPRSSPIPAFSKPHAPQEPSPSKRSIPENPFGNFSQKASTADAHPSMPPPVFKTPLKRGISATEPSTPSTTPAKTNKLHSSQANGNSRSVSRAGQRLEDSEKMPSTPTATASNPAAPPQPQTDESPRLSSNDKHWYKDEGTPFRMFKRHYESITPGKGNTYAAPSISNNNSEAANHASQGAKNGKGTKHDPFNLFL